MLDEWTMGLSVIAVGPATALVWRLLQGLALAWLLVCLTRACRGCCGCAWQNDE